MMRYIAILMLAIYTPVCIATTCDDALNACGELVQAQDKEIQDLKKDVKKLEGVVAEQSKTPIVPLWAVFIVGAATCGVGAAVAVPLLIGVGAGIGAASLSQIKE